MIALPRDGAEGAIGGGPRSTIRWSDLYIDGAAIRFDFFGFRGVRGRRLLRRITQETLNACKGAFDRRRRRSSAIGMFGREFGAGDLDPVGIGEAIEEEKIERPVPGHDAIEPGAIDITADMGQGRATGLRCHDVAETNRIGTQRRLPDGAPDFKRLKRIQFSRYRHGFQRRAVLLGQEKIRTVRMAQR